MRSKHFKSLSIPVLALSLAAAGYLLIQGKGKDGPSPDEAAGLISRQQARLEEAKESLRAFIRNHPELGPQEKLSGDSVAKLRAEIQGANELNRIRSAAKLGKDPEFVSESLNVIFPYLNRTGLECEAMTGITSMCPEVVLEILDGLEDRNPSVRGDCYLLLGGFAERNSNFKAKIAQIVIAGLEEEENVTVRNTCYLVLGICDAPLN
jgi:hypothetical protein